MSEDRRRLKVDPLLVFGLSLIVSLALSWPGFAGAMNGSADIIVVGVRFLIAVAVVWTGLFLVASLIAGYAASTPTGAVVSGDRIAVSTPSATNTITHREVEADNAAASAIAADTESVAG